MNRGFLSAWILLLACLVMMIVACALPDWSTGDLSRVGLWQYCSRLLTTDGFSCAKVPDPANSNGHMITSRVTATWGTVDVFLAFIFCSVALVARHRIFGQISFIFCLTSFVLICVAYAMWLGEHGTYFNTSGLGLQLGASFILCCLSDGLLLMCVVLSFWGMRIARKMALKATNAPDIEDAPGMSEDEANRFADIKLDRATAGGDSLDADGYMAPPPTQDGNLVIPSPSSPSTKQRELGIETKPLN